MTKLIRFDWAIKYLLRHKANFDILEGFLSELLKTAIKIETILESESNKHHAEDKFNRVDLLVKTAEGKYVIVEVQCDGQFDYLSRILYGVSKVVCEYLRESDAYRKICKVISVSIVFFNLGTGKDYLYKGTTSFTGIHYGDTFETTHHVAPQTPENVFPEYYLIKVSQFHDRVQDKIDEWIYFLKNTEVKREFTAQGLQVAAEKLDVLRLSEQERRAYERYKEGLHDDSSLEVRIEVEKKIARTEGLNEGRAEGRTEERRQIAQIAQKSRSVRYGNFISYWLIFRRS